MSKKNQPKKKYLDQSEINRLDLGTSEKDIRQRDVTIAKNRKALLDLQVQLFLAKSTIENFKIAEAEVRVEANRKSQKEFSDLLRTKYKIDGEAFGYSPMSGEISEGSSTTKE